MANPVKQDECPLCSCIVPVVLLDSHVNSHLDDEELARDRALAQQIASTSEAPCCNDSSGENSRGRRGKCDRDYNAVKCNRGCKQDVPIEEWDSHCLQHKLALEEAAGEDAELYERNFSKRARGSSHGEDQSYIYQVNKVLRGRSLEENISSLMGSQMRESVISVEGGLMRLLQRCLEADQRAGFSTVALSGCVEHFESRQREDLGWGCGWRNIQMLVSHLLVQDPEAKGTLFGGCGFVPDILALQRWLEIAWAKGFDIPGAQYFDWEIDGTHKWIGTTECAALLRSFGIRARIVDFQAYRGKVECVEIRDRKSCSDTEPKRNNPLQKARESRQPSPVDFEEGECVGCGEYPIQGMRYRRHDLETSDLCILCMEKLRNSCNKHDRATADEYVGVGVDSGKVSYCDKEEHHSDTESPREDTVNHRHIVDWIWNYFIERAENKCSSNVFDRLRQPMILSKRSPLYFQHRGHSRTIVGIERRWRQGAAEEVFLIVLDPSQTTKDIVKALKEKSGWQRLLKRGLHTLKQAEYQLCYVDHGVAAGDELESLKVLSSIHYTY